MTCGSAHWLFMRYARVAVSGLFSVNSRGVWVAARSFATAGAVAGLLLSMPLLTFAAAGSSTAGSSAAGSSAAGSSPAGASAPGSPFGSRAEVRERVMRSIVGIRVSRTEPKLAFKGRFKVTADLSPGQGTGSGIVVDASGLVLTCAHVLASQGRARIFLPNGREAAGNVMIVDPATDLALLRIEGTSVTALDLRRAPALRQGGAVFLASRPGGEEARYSEETLAAEGAFHAGHSDLEFLRQFLGDIEPGDSGGALVDEEGRLVGVLSSGVPQGRVGYAIARELVLLALARMRTGAPVVWPWLGAGVESPTDGSGVRVWTVARGSPAESAGIRAGDRIVALDGHPLEHFLPAMMAVIARPVGTSFRLSVRRAGDDEAVRATVLPVVSGPRPLEPDLQPFDVFAKLTGIQLGLSPPGPARGAGGATAPRVVVLEDAAAGAAAGAKPPDAAPPLRDAQERDAPPRDAPERDAPPHDAPGRRAVVVGSKLLSVTPGVGVVMALEEGRTDQQIPIETAVDLDLALRAATLGNSMTAVIEWTNGGRREPMLLTGERRRFPLL